MKIKNIPRSLKFRIGAVLALEYPLYLLIIWLLRLFGLPLNLFLELMVLFSVFGVGMRIVGRIIKRHFDSQSEDNEKIDF